LWDRSEEAPPIVVGVDTSCREVLVTSVTGAEPGNKTLYPEPSIWPFLCAVVSAAFFVASIFTPWALPVAIVPLSLTLIGWFWPKRSDRTTQCDLASSPLRAAQGRDMNERAAVDVSRAPAYAFGPQGLIWWGTVGFMVIEGSMFVMALIVYFYLRLKVTEWPPSLPNPDFGYGTVNILLVLASCVPNQWAKRAAERFDLRDSRVWLTVLVLIGVVSLGLRAMEYTQLHCRWDDNAYGSIVWLLLSMHTIHVATDVVDSGVLLALIVTEPVTERRFVDISENSLYWYFIVAWWIPIYLTIYFGPRWL
jgi:cytochrome c oxidase subunit 1/cytochrome c oxidase subunit I+III